MTAMVSSIIRLLLRRANDAVRADEMESNACARRAGRAATAALLVLLPLSPLQAQRSTGDERSGPSRAQATVRFAGGAVVGLLAHEAGHVTVDLAFGADPHIKRVEFHGIPFFAIAPRADVSRRERFTIASAGFWVQHAGSEWILTRRPSLRHERAPFAKGVLAFNVVASAAYAGAAFARTGPLERDTYGMAEAGRMPEPVVGALVLAPAVLDTWRYYHPGSKWAAWTSRGLKAGLVLLVLR